MDDFDFISDSDFSDFIEHFGVKGMRWGVRRDSAPGVSKATDKTARKDAEEFARAKLFFGEGAGTRRKLIKATVEAKAKKDPTYQKAFDHHLSRQDLSTHANKARSERKSIDRKTRNKQRAGAVARRLTGEFGTQAALVAVVAGGAAYMRSPKARAFTSRKVSDIRRFVTQKQNLSNIQNFLNNQGL